MTEDECRFKFGLDLLNLKKKNSGLELVEEELTLFTQHLYALSVLPFRSSLFVKFVSDKP